MRNHRLPLMFLLLLCACAGSTIPERTVLLATETPAVAAGATLPVTPATRTATPTHVLSLTSIVTPSVVRVTATPGPSPTSTSTPVTPAVPMPVRGSILIAYGEHNNLALAHVEPEGEIWLLSEPLGISDSYWRHSSLSPDGTWLAYYSSNAGEWRLYNLWMREDVSLGDLGEVSRPIFNTTGQHLAFLESVYPLTAGRDTWFVHIRDIATGMDTRFQGPIVAPGHLDDEPLRGEPIAWVGEELLLNILAPPESPNLDIRALDVSKVVPGETVSLRQYDRLVLSHKDVEYMGPTISPDNEVIAFVVWDHDHRPSCLDNSFGTITGLGVVPVAGGPARLLVDVTGTDSALAAQPLTWSPDGSQVLFAQGTCQDASSPFELMLRTVDLQGNIIHEWPLVRLQNTCCQEALWCTPEQIFYLRGNDQLWRLNVETGQSEQVLSSNQIRLVGCFP